MTLDSRIKLVKGIISNIDISYDLFKIQNAEIFTRESIKKWSFKFDKRIIIKVNDDYIDTIPFGY